MYAIYILFVVQDRTSIEKNLETKESQVSFEKYLLMCLLNLLNYIYLYSLS